MAASVAGLRSRDLGREVMVQLEDGTALTGMLQQLEADALVLAGTDTQQRLTAGKIRKITMRTGSEREAGWFGALLGTGAGLIGSARCEPCDTWEYLLRPDTLWVVLFFALIGALIGRLLGRFWKRWRTVYVARAE